MDAELSPDELDTAYDLMVTGGYLVIKAYSLEALVFKVNQKINDGYIALGGVVVAVRSSVIRTNANYGSTYTEHTDTFYQAMYRKEQNESTS